MTEKQSIAPAGVTGDKNGPPSVDPTANVLSLVEAAVQRLDDLRNAEARRIDQLTALRAEHSAELAAAEAKRIDAIRAVDVNAVAVASERATQQAAVLAGQVASSADALRALVAQTAQTMAQGAEKFSAQLTERLAALEKSSYEGKGRQGLSDPMLVDLINEMKGLRESRATVTGKGEGSAALWGFIVGGVGLVSALVVGVVALIRFGAVA